MNSIKQHQYCQDIFSSFGSIMKAQIVKRLQNTELHRDKHCTHSYLFCMHSTQSIYSCNYCSQPHHILIPAKSVTILAELCTLFVDVG